MRGPAAGKPCGTRGVHRRCLAESRRHEDGEVSRGADPSARERAAGGRAGGVGFHFVSIETLSEEG